MSVKRSPSSASGRSSSCGRWSASATIATAAKRASFDVELLKGLEDGDAQEHAGERNRGRVRRVATEDGDRMALSRIGAGRRRL